MLKRKIHDLIYGQILKWFTGIKGSEEEKNMEII